VGIVPTFCPSIPFNKGDRHGAGNPPGENGDYRTSYLWLEAVQKDSLIDILARFLHLETKETKISTASGIKHQIKETLIFPRYHQLDVVRKLILLTHLMNALALISPLLTNSFSSKFTKQRSRLTHSNKPHGLIPKKTLPPSWKNNSNNFSLIGWMVTRKYLCK
jgi:type I restriction enzyme, R subunit